MFAAVLTSQNDIYWHRRTPRGEIPLVYLAMILRVLVHCFDRGLNTLRTL